MKRHQLIAADSVKIPNISVIGFSDDSQITRYGPSVRNKYIIHYVLSGKGVFNGNTVERGQGFLIVPGMKQEYYPDEHEPWSFLWIISEDAHIRYFFSCHNADRKTGIFKFHNIYEMETISAELNTVWEGLSSSAQLSEMFLRIFNSCIANEDKRQSSVTKIYYEFSVNYINTNLHLPITVKELCELIGVTQPYLYKIFRQEAACSPKQYILSCKLAEAKRLLLQTDFSISQIAASVGFCNILDFSKFFSGQMNTSPTAYRKNGLPK